MGIGKPHIEFMKLDMDEGWETPPGYPPGMQQKVLSGVEDVETRQAQQTPKFTIE